MYDSPLVSSILRSRRTLNQFLAAFETRERAQKDFMVVFLEEHVEALVPVGILVEQYDDETISGRRVPNGLRWNPSNDKTQCQRSEIIDWRYVDTLEMEGGVTFLELYGRQHRRVQFTVRDHQPFLICREKEIDHEVLEVFRDVANARCDRLNHRSVTTLTALSADMPLLSFDIGRRVCVSCVELPEYAAMYGNREVIDLLAEKGVLRVGASTRSPLLDSCFAGNLDTTCRLFELGWNFESANEMGDTPLIQAVTWNHVDVAKFILKKGADPEARNIDKETALFRATSGELALTLIQAGASVNAINDNDDSCLAVQIFRGNRGVVKVLVDHGAELKYGRRGVSGDRRLDGRRAVLEWLSSTGNTEGLRELAIAESVDYGCVLPVRFIDKNELAGLY